MKIVLRFGSLFIITTLAFAATALAENSSHNPTWWDKYTYLAKNGPLGEGGSTSSIGFGSNVDLSYECGPQSEPLITLKRSSPKMLVAGTNEIFRVRMR